MSENDNNEKVPGEDQIPRSDSSASSVISRTSSPEPLQETDGVFGEETEVSPEQLSADMAARGIINPRNKISDSPPQSGMRGMLIAACDIESNTVNETQEAHESGLQEEKKTESEQLLDKHAVLERTDKNVTVPQEMSFFNKDSSTSRPSTASSSSSVGDRTNKREVYFQDSEGDHLLQKERSFISHPENTTIEVVSICTQTEWSWLKDMELYQEISHRSKPDWADRTDRKLPREEPKSPSGNTAISMTLLASVKIVTPPLWGCSLEILKVPFYRVNTLRYQTCLSLPQGRALSTPAFFTWESARVFEGSLFCSL